MKNMSFKRSKRLKIHNEYLKQVIKLIRNLNFRENTLGKFFLFKFRGKYLNNGQSLKAFFGDEVIRYIGQP